MTTIRMQYQEVKDRFDAYAKDKGINLDRMTVDDFDDFLVYNKYGQTYYNRDNDTIVFYHYPTKSFDWVKNRLIKSRLNNPVKIILNGKRMEC
jgi:hypothetical protein